MNPTAADMKGSTAKMVADSTSTEPVKTKKKKKLSGGPKSKKKKTSVGKKSRARAGILAISSLHDDSDSDLDLKKSLKPISGYIKARGDMLEQMFHSVRGPSLQRTMPDILKDLPIEELKQRCLEQLENMSKKRIRRIIGGDKPEDISSSGTEEESSDEEDGGLERQDADSTSQPADAGADNIADIEGVDDEQLLADVASSMHTHKSSLPNKQDQSAPADPSADAGLKLNIAPLLDHSELEILELEMRARAIKAMLRASVQRGQDSSEQAGQAELDEIGEKVDEEQRKQNTKQTAESQLKAKIPAKQNAGQNSPFENLGSKPLGQKAGMQIIIGQKAKEPFGDGKKAEEKKNDGQKKTEDEETELKRLLDEQKKKAAMEKPESQPGNDVLPIKVEKSEVESQPAKDQQRKQRSYSRSRSSSDSGSERRRPRRRYSSDSYSDRGRSEDSDKDSRHSRTIRRRRRYRKRRRSSSRSSSYNSDRHSSDDFSSPHRHKYPLQMPSNNQYTTNTNPYSSSSFKKMKWVKKPKRFVDVEDREEGEVSDESEWEQVTDNEQTNVVIKTEPKDGISNKAKNRHRLMSGTVVKTEPVDKSTKATPSEIQIKVEPQDDIIKTAKQNESSVIGSGVCEIKTWSEDVHIVVPTSTLEYITIESSDSDMDSVSSVTPEVTALVTPEITASVTPDITASVTPDVTASVTPDVTASVTPDVTTSVGTIHIKVEEVSSSANVLPVSVTADRVVKTETDSEQVSMEVLEEQPLGGDTLSPKTETIDSKSSESQGGKSDTDSCNVKQETHNVGQSEEGNNQQNNVEQTGAVTADILCSEKQPTEEPYSQASSPHISVKSSEEPDSEVINVSSTGKCPSSQTISFSQESDADLPENVDNPRVQSVAKAVTNSDVDEGDTIDSVSDIVIIEQDTNGLNMSLSKEEGNREAQSGAKDEATKGKQSGGEGEGCEGEQGGFEVESGEEDHGGSEVESSIEDQNGSVQEESEDIQDWSDLEGRKEVQGGLEVHGDKEDSQGVSQKHGGKRDGQGGSEVQRNKQNSQGGSMPESRADSQGGSGVGGSNLSKEDRDGSEKDGSGCVVVTDEESGGEDRTQETGSDSDSNVSDGQDNAVDKPDTEDTEDEDRPPPDVTVTAEQARQQAESNDDAVMLDDDNEILD